MFPRLASAKPNLYSAFNLQRELETFWESGKEYIRLQKFHSSGNGGLTNSSKKLLKHLPLYAEVLAEYFIPPSEAYNNNTLNNKQLGTAYNDQMENTSAIRSVNPSPRQQLIPIGLSGEEELVRASSGSLKSGERVKVTIVEPNASSYSRQTTENGNDIGERAAIRSRDSGFGMGDLEQQQEQQTPQIIRPNRSRQSRRGTTPAANGRAMSVGSRTGGWF